MCSKFFLKGVINRDQFVFSKVRSLNVPIVMLTSGGYQKTNARVIADSIINLEKNNLISLLPNQTLNHIKDGNLNELEQL